MFEQILADCDWHPVLRKDKSDSSLKFLDTIWDQIEFKAPKIIVALSLTSSYERTLPKNAVVFPAILDTGFNRTLEIDERQLLKKEIGASRWVKRLLIDTGVRDNEGKRRDSYASQVHIWLHRMPYHYKMKGTNDTAILLGESKRLRVVVPPESVESKEPAAWPPLPLLGLEAIKANALQLQINGELLKFSLSKYKH